MPSKTSKSDARGRLEIETRAQLQDWLRKHHRTSMGVWVVTYKKASGKPRVTYDEVVEELLCFGWIDSLARKLDEQRSMLLCTPRKPTSKWSRINKERVAKLEAEGRMQDRGRELVELAKRTGTWDALDTVDALVVPPDLDDSFRSHPGSRANFDAFPPSVRRGILEWILNAKRPETRAKRLEETAQAAARNERANQWKR